MRLARKETAPAAFGVHAALSITNLQRKAAMGSYIHAGVRAFGLSTVVNKQNTFHLKLLRRNYITL